MNGAALYLLRLGAGALAVLAAAAASAVTTAGAAAVKNADAGHVHQATHEHVHDDQHAAKAREIGIEMRDTMRFVPAEISVRAGETVRFVLTNKGAIEHEFVVGSEAELEAHRRQMQAQASANADHAHGHDGEAGVSMLAVAPGAKGTLTKRFDEVGDFRVACLISGHYEAGMRATIHVMAAKAKPKK